MGSRMRLHTFLGFAALTACEGAMDDLAVSPHADAVADPVLSALPDRVVPPPPVLRSPGDTPDVVVYGYYPYWGDPLDTLAWDQLTHLALFSVGLDTAGNLTDQQRWTGNAATALQLAQPWGVRIHMTVTSFSDAVNNVVLPSPALRTAAINNIVALMNQHGGHGVNIDFEGLDAARRADFVAFIQELRARVPELWIATPPVDWNGAFDYAALAGLADGLFIMGYNYHWSGGNPGPVAPLYGGSPWAIHSLDWSVNDYRNYGAPNAKITLGLPLYGIDWPSTGTGIPGTKTANGSSVMYASGLGRFASYGRNFDAASRSPYTFPSSTNQTWVDDADAVAERVQYAVDEGLQGVGFWALTYDDGDAGLWTAVDGITHSAPVTPVPVPQPLSNLVFAGVSPGVAGRGNTFSITGAAPGATVGILAGFQAGTTAVPGCGGTVPVGGARYLGYTYADSAGRAQISMWVPRTVAGRNIQLWAFDVNACVVSAGVSETF